jgi:hypothetical protein
MIQEITIKENGFAWIQAEPLLQLGLLHGFSTRLGGSSQEPYGTLNLGLHVNDNQKTVIANRAGWAKAMGFSLDKSVWGEQIHGSEAAYVTDEHYGRGALSFKETISGVDGLFTDIPGIPLMAVFADCVPVFIYDSVRKCIGIVHAGWRGIVSHNTEKTIERMEGLLGSRRSDMSIYIGPCIGKVRYGVDNRVNNQFERAGYGKHIVQRSGLHYIDLRNALADALIDFGVAKKNVCVSSYCTYEEETLFYSHRRDKGQTGRMAGVIMMELEK